MTTKKYEWALDSKGSFDVSLLLQKKGKQSWPVATFLLHCSGHILKGFHTGHALFVQTINKLLQKRYSTFYIDQGFIRTPNDRYARTTLR